MDPLLALFRERNDPPGFVASSHVERALCWEKWEERQEEERVRASWSPSRKLEKATQQFSDCLLRMTYVHSSREEKVKIADELQWVLFVYADLGMDDRVDVVLRFMSAVERTLRCQIEGSLPFKYEERWRPVNRPLNFAAGL